MKIESVSLGFNHLSYDEFTWSDNDRASSMDKILVSVPISREQLKSLSKAIYQNYLEVIRDVPDYFDSWDEPFPSNENEVYNNPEKLFSYFSKSSLWSNFLIKSISEIQNWDMSQSKYHVLNVNKVNEFNNTLCVVMTSIKINK